MNTHQRDPLVDQLDRLAQIADNDLVPDRIPGIQRRVRQARLLKVGVALAAASVVAVGGVGVWQGMTAPDDGQPLSPDLSQSIELRADPQGNGRIAIRFTVSGEATVFFDSVTGERLDYAGPTSTLVRVDGETVSETAAPESLECRSGHNSAPYSEAFHDTDPLVVPAIFRGEHRVVVRVTYCADGQILETVARTTVVTEGEPTIVDRLKPDLDGDGVYEFVTLTQPADPAADLILEVTWGDGSSQSATLANTMERRLETADLDGDGDQEIVVVGGGGETSETRVYVVDAGDLVEASYLNAEGRQLKGLYGGAVPTDWNPRWVFGGIYSARNPSAGPYPAPMELRQWSLSGRTLTESATVTEGCLTEGGSISLGPCSG
jgi:hypothetical protein